MNWIIRSTWNNLMNVRPELAMDRMAADSAGICSVGGPVGITKSRFCRSQAEISWLNNTCIQSDAASVQVF